MQALQRAGDAPEVRQQHQYGEWQSNSFTHTELARTWWALPTLSGKAGSIGGIQDIVVLDANNDGRSDLADKTPRLCGWNVSYEMTGGSQLLYFPIIPMQNPAPR